MKRFFTYLLMYFTTLSLAQAGQPRDHHVPFGHDKAPVTITEYTSLTCHHCADFHLFTLPILKQKYVNTGKLRFVIKPLPLDKDALMAAKLVHSLPQDKQEQAMTRLYTTQNQWIGMPPEKAASIIGLNKDQCDKAMNDKVIENELLFSAYKAQKELKIDATPIFVCDGVKHEGAYTLKEFEEAYDPLLNPGKSNSGPVPKARLN